MFKYKGCKGEKAKLFTGKNIWMLTFEDGKHDMAYDLSIALMLCDGRLKRA